MTEYLVYLTFSLGLFFLLFKKLFVLLLLSLSLHTRTHTHTHATTYKKIFMYILDTVRNETMEQDSRYTII